MSRVRLYGKPGCHLCEEARAELAGFEVEEVDVSADPALNARYGERVPVVEVNGEEIAHFHVNATEVQAALDRVIP